MMDKVLINDQNDCNNELGNLQKKVLRMEIKF